MEGFMTVVDDGMTVRAGESKKEGFPDGAGD